MKVCSKCGEEKALEAFHRRKASKDGREHSCKACRAVYYQTNKARMDTRNEAWRKANPKRALEIRRKAGKKLAATGYYQRWRDANREKWREYGRRAYHKNPEGFAERHRRFKAENPDWYPKYWAMVGQKYRDEHKRRYREDPEYRKRDLARHRRYRLENPHIIRDGARRRRARERNAFVEEVVEAVIIDRDLGICGICGQAVMGPLELDHVIPYAAGGTHEPDNVQLAHRACNRRKNSKVDYTPE